MKVAPASRSYNCHGLLFGNRQKWIGDPRPWLEEQGYALVGTHPAATARPGDIVLYWKTGQVTHSGRVSSIGQGNRVIVHSKWGELGEYLHDVHDVPKGRDGLPDFGISALYRQRKLLRVSNSLMHHTGSRGNAAALYLRDHPSEPLHPVALILE